jgi:hypothetical protein
MWSFSKDGGLCDNMWSFSKDGGLCDNMWSFSRDGIITQMNDKINMHSKIAGLVNTRS